MAKRLIGIPLALILLVQSSGLALATTTTLTPSYQSHIYGSPAHWNMTWSGTAPFRIAMDYGDDKGFAYSGVYFTSAQANHGFYPCPGSPGNGTFYQVWQVRDSTNQVAVKTSSAYEVPGYPGSCTWRG